MSRDSNIDDRAVRQARADAIRRARDKRNASLNVPAEADQLNPEESTGPADDPAASAGTESGPNYVEFIDRKMRQKKKV